MEFGSWNAQQPESKGSSGDMVGHLLLHHLPGQGMNTDILLSLSFTLPGWIHELYLTPRKCFEETSKATMNVQHPVDEIAEHV